MRALLALPVMLACTVYCAERPVVSIPLHDGEGAVQGHLRGHQQRQYEISAAGKALTVSMDASPPRTLAVKVYDTSGGEVSLQRIGAGRWSASLPAPGRYRITVVRAHAGAGTATYRLVVMVR